MCPVIDTPTSCKICTVIRFHQDKNMSAAEIHHALFAVYSQNIVSEGAV
jgi:hypothetical protein